VEVEREEPVPPGNARPRDVERHHEAAAPGHAAHLGEAAAEVGQVPQQERGGHRREGAVAEGQGERVGGQQRHAALAAPRELRGRLAQHPLGEVGADHGGARPGAPDGEGEVRGAGGQVEHEPGRRGAQRGRGRAPPGVVTAAGHERVHDVVAARDAREHRADVLAPGRRRGRRYHQSPPTTPASTITAM